MIPVLRKRYRRALFATLLGPGLVAVFLTAAAITAEPLVAQEATQGHEGRSGEGKGESGWGSTVAKAVNFAALAGLLAYFLKTPFGGYLRTRSDTIRKDLVDAAALRSSAEQQLAEVRTRLATLPAELDALRRRGQDELAEERARLASTTAREKDHVLDRTRREIDVQFRMARRRLVEHAADVAMSLARRRLERGITADDQARLIDRYAAEVHP